MANTVHQGYSKPVTSNYVSNDVELLQAALDAIDGDVFALFEALSGKAAASHEHAIADVTGLQGALDGKSATDHAHKLDDLSDVSGADGAPSSGGYVLVKTTLGWVPIQAATLLALHSHTTSDITDLAAALASKASLTSPVFSGTPTVPTAAAGSNTLQAANTAYVRVEIAALVASAPSQLDTIDELAAALGDDANFAATITALIGAKAPTSRTITAGAGLSGGGDLSANRSFSVNTAWLASQSVAYAASAGNAATLNNLPSSSFLTSVPTTAGGIGTYIFAQYGATDGGSTHGPGFTTSGANLIPSDATGTTGSSLSGTWQLMGATKGTGFGGGATLWVRIS